MSADQYLSRSVQTGAGDTATPAAAETAVAGLPMSLRLSKRVFLDAPINLLIGIALAAAISVFFSRLAYEILLSPRDNALLPGFAWSVLILSLLLAGSISLISQGLVTFADIKQGGPMLVIEADGFRDLRRSPDLIRWSEVATYSPTWTCNGRRTGIVLDLQHRAPAAIHSRRSFLGALGARRLLRAHQVHVRFFRLTAPADEIFDRIAALIEMHGGKPRRQRFAILT